MALYLSDYILDNGLDKLNTDADRIDICSTVPDDYTGATSTYTCGNKTFTRGDVFGACSAATPDGRKVTMAAVSAGEVTATDDVVCIAISDSTNSRLLACIDLDTTYSVTDGHYFNLSTADIGITLSSGVDIVFDENWPQDATFYQTPVSGYDEPWTISDGSSGVREVDSVNDGYLRHINTDRSSGPFWSTDSLGGDVTHNIIQFVIRWPSATWMRNNHHGKRMRIDTNGGRGLGEWDTGNYWNGSGYNPIIEFNNGNHNMAVDTDYVITVICNDTAHTYDVEIDGVPVENDLPMAGSGDGTALTRFYIWSTEEGDIQLGRIVVADGEVM